MASNWRNPNLINTVNPPTGSATAAQGSSTAATRPVVSSTIAIPAPGFGTTSAATFSIVRAPGTRRPSLEALIAIPPPLRSQPAASPYAAAPAASSHTGGASGTMSRLGLAVAREPAPSKDRLTVVNLARVAAASYVSEEKKMSRIAEWVNKVEDEIL